MCYFIKKLLYISRISVGTFFQRSNLYTITSLNAQAAAGGVEPTTPEDVPWRSERYLSDSKPLDGSVCRFVWVFLCYTSHLSKIHLQEE